jgi:gliding motility-associated lipoprotein GldH
MKKFWQLATLVVVVGFVLSCNENLVFEQYKTISKKSWDKDSVLVFTIPVSDTTDNHNLYINIRNDVNYQYSNIWLFISIEQPDGKMLEDKFEIALADPSGKWLGEGLGGLKTREAIYRRNVFFPMSGDYKIRIQQGMREDILKGISDVGIRIEKVE